MPAGTWKNTIKFPFSLLPKWSKQQPSPGSLHFGWALQENQGLLQSFLTVSLSPFLLQTWMSVRCWTGAASRAVPTPRAPSSASASRDSGSTPTAAPASVRNLLMLPTPGFSLTAEPSDSPTWAFTKYHYPFCFKQPVRFQVLPELLFIFFRFLMVSRVGENSFAGGIKELRVSSFQMTFFKFSVFFLCGTSQQCPGTWWV